MKNKKGQVLIHITGCIAFLSLPVLLSPDVSWNFHFIKMSPFQEDFVSYTMLLLFFYLNYFYLIPRLYFKQKFIFYFGCLLLSYAAIALLPHLLVPGNHVPLALAQHRNDGFERPPARRDAGSAAEWRAVADSNHFDDGPEHPGKGDHSFAPPQARPNMQPPPVDQGPPGQDRQGSMVNDSDQHRGQAPPNHNGPPGNRPPSGRGRDFFFRIPNFEYLFQFMMVLVLSTLIRINNRLKQAEKEKVNAELSYLKAQINPHFLFNTLNSIYSSAIEENADNTASAVVKLSGMMRYVISEAHHQYVPLEKELNYISDYIELQKIRLGETVHLKYGVTGTAAGKQIAPLILISFIENAFKHGVNPEEPSSIDIEIDIDAGVLHLSVLNNKVNTVNSNSSPTNVGILNTTNRLQLLYPSKHELAIKDDEKQFLVLLNITLT